MSWQDVILSIGGLIGAIALFPSILSEHKPALATSLMNGGLAVAIMVVDFSLGLLYAGAVAILIAALWLILAAQQWERTHHAKVRAK